MKQLRLGVLALLCATMSTPAFACSYPYASEPVGGPSAGFIAKRMVDAAAYVDLAVPERAQPMRTPDGRPLAAQSVTFRVVERLKGASPDRFILFAKSLKPAGSKVEPAPLLHWVDETTGGIYPDSTPWEAPATEQFMMTSCDPGFIEPVGGRTYLIFREADGGLLGRVTFHSGQPSARGYAFTEQTQAFEGEWARAVRRHSSRSATVGPVAARNVLPPAFEVDATRASASFRRPLTENETRQLLQRAGARPYAVYVAVRDRRDVYRVPEAQASLEAVAGARRHVAATIGAPPAPSHGLAVRARAVVDSYTPEQLAKDTSKLAYARALISSVQLDRQAADVARSDAPFIYAVEFLGGAETQRRLAASSQVGEVRPGFRIRGRAAAPEPQVFEAGRGAAGFAPDVANLSAAELHAKLRVLAE